jgi:hypothetical protein
MLGYDHEYRVRITGCHAQQKPKTLLDLGFDL